MNLIVSDISWYSRDCVEGNVPAKDRIGTIIIKKNDKVSNNNANICKGFLMLKSIKICKHLIFDKSL